MFHVLIKVQTWALVQLWLQGLLHKKINVVITMQLKMHKFYVLGQIIENLPKSALMGGERFTPFRQDC